MAMANSSVSQTPLAATPALFESPRSRLRPFPFELVRDVRTIAEVHFIGRLPAKRRVGENLVVLGDIERNESLDGGDGVERIHEQPLVLQPSPPGFDQRVRVRDFGQGEESSGSTSCDDLIDGAVVVLDATIGK